MEKNISAELKIVIAFNLIAHCGGCSEFTSRIQVEEQQAQLLHVNISEHYGNKHCRQVDAPRISKQSCWIYTEANSVGFHARHWFPCIGGCVDDNQPSRMFR
jgi:hypothetical protein